MIQQLSIKTPSPNFLVVNMSGGNQQKVILARWLSIGTRIFIMDEPTRGIDGGSKSEIGARLSRGAERRRLQPLVGRPVAGR